MIPRTRLPPQIFDSACTEWVELASGRWAFEGHVTLGESRVAVRLAQMLARDVQCHCQVAMMMEDNSLTAASFTKGRSPAPALNYLLRKRCAHCAASRIKLLLPWVEGAIMPADSLSRRMWGCPRGSPASR